jgi:hypothetical protein
MKNAMCNKDNTFSKKVNSTAKVRKSVETAICNKSS